MPNYRLPEQERHWLDVKNWVEPDPDPNYTHAPESAVEAFRDIKFAVRIHWGLYSLLHLQGESWPFLKMENEQKQAYQQLYHGLTPTGFDAEEWMSVFKRAGLESLHHHQHHEVFPCGIHKLACAEVIMPRPVAGARNCELAYSGWRRPSDRHSPGAMRPAHKIGIKIEFYFSHPDCSPIFALRCLLFKSPACSLPEEYGGKATTKG